MDTITLPEVVIPIRVKVIEEVQGLGPTPPKPWEDTTGRPLDDQRCYSVMGKSRVETGMEVFRLWNGFFNPEKHQFRIVECPEGVKSINQTPGYIEVIFFGPITKPGIIVWGVAEKV